VCNYNDFAVNDGYFDIELLGFGVNIRALFMTSALMMKLDYVLKNYETFQFSQSTRSEWLCDVLLRIQISIWISYNFGTSNLIIETLEFQFSFLASFRRYKVLI